MTEGTNRYQRIVRSLAASTVAVFLVAASSPVEAGLLGRAIGVGGVVYSLKKNLGDLTDTFGDMMGAAVKGDTGAVAESWEEVKSLPGRLIVDAFPVFGVARAVGERAQSAKERVKGFFGGAGKAVADARAALAISREERKWYKSETKVLDSRPLPAARSRLIDPSGSARLGATTAKAGSSPGKPGWLEEWVEAEQRKRPNCYGAVTVAKAAECERDVWAEKWREEKPVTAKAPKGGEDPSGRATEPAAREDELRKSADPWQSEYEKALEDALGGGQAKASPGSDYLEALKELEHKETERGAREVAERPKGSVQTAALKKAAKPKIVTKPQCVFGEDLLPFQELKKKSRSYRAHTFTFQHLGIPRNTLGYVEDEKDKYVIEMYERYGLRLEKCWLKVDNIPNCHYYRGAISGTGRNYSAYSTLYRVRRPTTKWSGKCVDGVVSGEGTLHVEVPNWQPWSGKHTFLKGKRHEKVSEQDITGEFIAGEKEGKWTSQRGDRLIRYVAHYVNGRLKGDCAVTYKGRYRSLNPPRTYRLREGQICGWLH